MAEQILSGDSLDRLAGEPFSRELQDAPGLPDCLWGAEEPQLRDVELMAASSEMAADDSGVWLVVELGAGRPSEIA